MSVSGARLVAVFASVYEPYVRAAVAGRVDDRLPDLTGAIAEGRRWLEGALEELLALPYPMQNRGPLELFQEAMKFPTTVLREAGYPPAPRDEPTGNALPGDLYDLAPASSHDLGEEAWQAHVGWGAAKAAALTRKRAGLLTRNLMDRSKLESGLERAGWMVAALTGPELPAGLDGVLVDLEHPAAFQVVAAAAGSIRCLAYGPHVNVEAFERARRTGADEALARSVVFRDIPGLAARLRRD